MRQKYSSADTSINAGKMPAIYSKISIDESQTAIDYGCGKFFDSYNLPANFHGFDPFNRNETELLTKHYDVALCSNVLNVVAEPEIRAEILKTLHSLADVVYITVYEGNRSGIGKPSKNDCFQLNRRAADYTAEIETVFETVTYKNGLFTCR